MQFILKVLSGIICIAMLSSFLNLLFDTRDPDEKAAHKLVKQLSASFNKKYGLKFAGLREQGPEGKYISLGFTLSYPYILTKDQGRLLLLTCIDEALETFNSNQNFRQYMIRYPFNAENITFAIIVEPSNRAEVYYPDILVFSSFNNTLNYWTETPETRSGYYTEEKETIEEARKIVEEQQKADPNFRFK